MAITGFSVEIGQSQLTEGDSTEVTVVADLENGTTQDVTEEALTADGLSIDDADVATLDGATITGEGAGSAELTVEFAGETLTETITVEQADDGTGNGDDGTGDGDTPANNDSSSDDGLGPGMGITTGMIAVVIMTYMLYRRD